MKALLYKELRLAMHPICYLFIVLFPFMLLIPSYPVAIGFIYVLACYPILFLGANKGQQSNDLLYSVLLPIRKKDIVLARIFTVSLMQLVFILIMSALYPLALMIRKNIPNTADVGIGLSGFVSVLGVALVGFAIADLIFFPIYYKHGKSIVMSTLLTILGFIFYLSIFTIGLPYVPGLEGYKTALCDSGLGVQFGVLGGALVIYVLLHIVVYRVSSKLLEKVDF
ncbi:MAG: ABC-2 transporter permease [Bacilli bacterium]|nr:ABC-2 transporter permease [Bacilli bacterium]MBO6284809.1 ABC-2 transporter permease [Bacilli bacterium]